MGKRWKRFRATRLVTQMLRGRWDGFEREVHKISDEEIEDALQELDEAIIKRERAASNPLLQGQYTILIEERTRREDGRQEAKG